MRGIVDDDYPKSAMREIDAAIAYLDFEPSPVPVIERRYYYDE